MELYTLIFAIVILLLYIRNVSGSKISIVIALIVLIIFSGFRYEVGKDFTTYWTIFNKPEWSSIELGYKWISTIVIDAGLGPQIIFILSSALTIILIHKSICYYCNPSIIAFCYACFLFGGFYLESFNLVRQYVAISIFFYATRYIISKEFIKYVGFILLGSLSHLSILVMIPFYFILNRNYTNFQVIIVFASAIFFKLSVSLESIMLRVPIYGIRYLENHSEYVVNANLGMGFITKVLLMFIVIVFFREQLNRINHKNNVAINAFTFYCILMVLFMDMTIFLRIAYYFHIFIIIVLSNIQFCFRKESRYIINMVVALYIFILFVIQLIDIDGQLIPYNINTNLYLR